MDTVRASLALSSMAATAWSRRSQIRSRLCSRIPSNCAACCRPGLGVEDGFGSNAWMVAIASPRTAVMGVRCNNWRCLDEKTGFMTVYRQNRATLKAFRSGSGGQCAHSPAQSDERINGLATARQSAHSHRPGMQANAAITPWTRSAISHTADVNIPQHGRGTGWYIVLTPTNNADDSHHASPAQLSCNPRLPRTVLPPAR